MWRACVNSANDCFVVLGGKKFPSQNPKSFTWAGGVSM